MSYTPTEWKNGDTITAEKLNKIENGIEDFFYYGDYITLFKGDSDDLDGMELPCTFPIYDTLVITLNEEDYICPLFTINGTPDYTYYGAPYNEELEQWDYSVYPFSFYIVKYADYSYSGIFVPDEDYFKLEIRVSSAEVVNRTDTNDLIIRVGSEIISTNQYNELPCTYQQIYSAWTQGRNVVLILTTYGHEAIYNLSDIDEGSATFRHINVENNGTIDIVTVTISDNNIHQQVVTLTGEINS